MYMPSTNHQPYHPEEARQVDETSTMAEQASACGGT